MFGNLCKESGVVDRISNCMQNELINIVTIMLGLSVGSKLQAEKFLNADTLFILILGLIAFSFGTSAGLLLARLMKKFSKDPLNPLIGAAGVSAVPMAARVVNGVGLKYNPHKLPADACDGAECRGSNWFRGCSRHTSFTVTIALN